MSSHLPTSDCVISGEILSVEGSKVTISQTFEHCSLTNRFTIYGTREQPLFQLSEIEKLLGEINLHGTVASYDADEKVVRNVVYASTGKQRAIFLTEEGIMTLMHHVRASEIAKMFRRWVAKIVKTIILEIRCEVPAASQKLVQDAETARIAAEVKASAAEAALEKEREANETLKRQIKSKHQKGQSVYLLRNASDRHRNLWKIGKTRDLSVRTLQYSTAMPDGADLVHCCHTRDSSVVERVVHHILDKYRYEDNREWFQGDAEYFARVMDCVVVFVDGMTDAGDAVVGYKLDTRLCKLMKRVFTSTVDGDESDGSTGSTVIIQGNVTGDVNVNFIMSENVVSRFIEEKLERSESKGDRLWRSTINEIFSQWYNRRRRDNPKLAVLRPKKASLQLQEAGGTRLGIAG